MKFSVLEKFFYFYFHLFDNLYKNKIQLPCWSSAAQAIQSRLQYKLRIAACHVQGYSIQLQNHRGVGANLKPTSNYCGFKGILQSLIQIYLGQDRGPV